MPNWLFPMGEKSRTNFAPGKCLRACAARGHFCFSCIKFSNYIPRERKKADKKVSKLQHPLA